MSKLEKEKLKLEKEKLKLERARLKIEEKQKREEAKAVEKAKKAADKARKKEIEEQLKAIPEHVVPIAIDKSVTYSEPNPEDERDIIEEVERETHNDVHLERNSDYAYMLSVMRSLIASREAAQKLRIQMGNRICMTLLTRLGVRAGEKISDTLKGEALLMRHRMLNECKRVTDFLTTPTRRAIINELMKSKGIFSNVFEASLIASYNDMLRSEREHELLIEKALLDIPVIKHILIKVKGCGPFLAGYIACRLDPYAAPRPSSFWKYCGLDVVIDENGRGVARSARKEHQIKREYINKKGEQAIKDALTYNPRVRSKLIKVLGDCLIKAGDKYHAIFKGYYNRKMSGWDPEDSQRKGHAYNMAVRYMVKMFLLDIWKEWRALEGLEVVPSYAEAKLGLVHRPDTGATAAT